MPCLHGDSLMQEHIIYIEIEQDFTNWEVELAESFELDEQGYPVELDFE